MSNKTVKLNFLIEAGVARELHAKVPAGQRSKLVNAALKKELLRIKRHATTEQLLKIRASGPKVAMSEIVEALRADRSGH